MTRSVEIPEAAVAVEAETWARAASGGMWSQYTAATRQLLIDNAKPTARAALEAALPYLAPAEPVDFRRAAEEANVRMGQPRDWALPAPAGDGGLREALGDLVEHWRYKGENLQPWQEGGGPDPYEAGLDDAATALKKLLAAAPAVPQPVDREALVKVIAGPYDNWLTRHQAEVTADRVLALLAGEQGQVESPE